MLILSVIWQLLSNGSLLFSILITAAMAGLYSERSGIINIAIDGIMIIGALIYSLLGNLLSIYGNSMQFVVLIITAICGGIFSFFHGFASITLKAQQVISGMAINLLALGLGLFFVSIPSLSPGNMITTGFITIGIDNYQIINVFVVMSVLFSIFTFIFFKYTKYGIRFIAAGENPDSITSIGISIIKIRYISVFISGVLAALSGCMFTHFTSGQFRGDVQGYGYIALAILIFGQLKIQFIMLGSVLFSFLISLANVLWRLIGLNIADSFNQLLKITPFVLALLTMVLFSKYSKKNPKVNDETNNF